LSGSRREAPLTVMQALLRVLGQLVVPAAMLVAAFVLVLYSAALPPSLEGLKVYGPYVVFVLGAALAIGFNRGRVVFALITLAIACAAQQAWLQHGIGTAAASAVFAALTVFVPLNLAALAVLPERGTFNRHGALRLAVIAAEVAVTVWIVAAGQTGIIDWAYQRFLDPVGVGATRMPHIGIAATGLALLVALVAMVIARSAINASLAGAIVAFAVAVHVVTASTTFAIFSAAAALMVTLGVLQDSFRMAFRDELTGLPSRRALNERLMSVGRNYTIAMLDVDHFKSFNDTYGHEIGDQVLKMVAAKIADVSGGGRAYRYGGEEFTLLFPGKAAAEALPHLEALREEIESYRLALRGADRPRKPKGARRQRGGWRSRDGVSVTVSIGVAERNDRYTTPGAVIAAADRALYRAKERGRNRVSQ
jgi:GGDEF domain-containing protein